MNIVALSPVKLAVFGQPHAATAGAGVGLLGAVLVAMWNYMGWDNASTIAQEVERPRQTYPKAMIAAVILVSLTYILPFVAVYLTGIPASASFKNPMICCSLNRFFFMSVFSSENGLY